MEGEQNLESDQSLLGPLIATARNAYKLESDITPVIAARLLRAYGASTVDARMRGLAETGFRWRYHRKEEPGKNIFLMTDLGHLSFGDLATLLTTASMARTDKYLALIRRRVSGFQRGTRSNASKQTVWHATAFYNPAMVERLAVIFRFYHNFMLPEGEQSGKPKGERQTPAMKLGIAKGKVYVRDLLRF